jgi:hypothetical protein
MAATAGIFLRAIPDRRVSSILVVEAPSLRAWAPRASMTLPNCLRVKVNIKLL